MNKLVIRISKVLIKLIDSWINYEIQEIKIFKLLKFKFMIKREMFKLFIRDKMC